MRKQVLGGLVAFSLLFVAPHAWAGHPQERQGFWIGFAGGPQASGGFFLKGGVGISHVDHIRLRTACVRRSR